MWMGVTIAASGLAYLLSKLVDCIAEREADTTRYEFSVPDLKSDDVFDPEVGDLRFSVKGLLGDGQFSSPATMLKSTQLTIAQVADQLKQIEQNRGYEQARYAAKQLDYDAMCALVHHRDLADNDPNLMPSRFMLLPGASDEQLNANGNLDTFPWPVHEDGPQHFSVALLKQCLQLSGHYQSDEPLPRWSSVDHRDDVIDPTKVDLEPEQQSAEFDTDLQQAYQQYRQQHGIKNALKRYQPKEERQYTVQDGDTLYRIAQRQGYPYWTMLQAANADTVNAPDQLEIGSELTLSALHAEELWQWLDEQQERGRYWTQKGFFFPADYLSFSFDSAPSEQHREQTRSLFLNAYRHQPYHVFYHLYSHQSDRMTLLLPCGQDISVAVNNQSLETARQQLLSPYRLSLTGPQAPDTERPLPDGLVFDDQTPSNESDKDA